MIRIVQGHGGIIYQATNSDYTGLSETMPLYDIGDGKVRRSRSLSHSFGTHSVQHFGDHGVDIRVIPRVPSTGICFSWILPGDLGCGSRPIPIPNRKSPLEIVELPLDQLQEATWNPNRMDQAMTVGLKASLGRYDLVQALVVRPLVDGSYEVLSGNQRLQLLRELGHSQAPCVVFELDRAFRRVKHMHDTLAAWELVGCLGSSATKPVVCFGRL